MERFAHLYEFPSTGQVLILKDQVDGEPVVSVHFTLPGFGVNKSELYFKDNEEGYKKQDNAFDEFGNPDFALKYAEAIIAQTKSLGLVSS